MAWPRPLSSTSLSGNFGHAVEREKYGTLLCTWKLAHEWIWGVFYYVSRKPSQRRAGSWTPGLSTTLVSATGQSVELRIDLTWALTLLSGRQMQASLAATTHVWLKWMHRLSISHGEARHIVLRGKGFAFSRWIAEDGWDLMFTLRISLFCFILHFL